MKKKVLKALINRKSWKTKQFYHEKLKKKKSCFESTSQFSMSFENSTPQREQNFFFPFSSRLLFSRKKIKLENKKQTEKKNTKTITKAVRLTDQSIEVAENR
jgi:hypothetical protein